MSKVMLSNLISTPLDEERAEFQAVASALTGNPRLHDLVRFLGEMYFSGQTDEINEYRIATEVFARSKTVFNAGEDSIVRVEAHRLRKRLKEYYETQGKDHSIQMCIPAGRYVPVFTHVGPRNSVPAPSLPSPATPQRKRGLYGVAAAVLTAVALCLYLFVYFAHANAGRDGVGSLPLVASLPSSPPASQPLPSNAGFQPLRLIAGYSGVSQIDSAGASWGADKYFHGGRPWQREDSTVFRTSDPLLFRQWRTGEFGYDIPLPPGVYELHLYFVASNREGDDLATFTVTINDEKMLLHFDVVTDADGENIGDERVFRDISPDKDGMLHIDFASERGVPILNALEVLPGTPHAQLPIRLVTQNAPFRDHDGNIWHQDTYSLNGKMAPRQHVVTGSPDPKLYAAERYGHFSYAVPVDTRDRYTLVLHFAEFYFGPTAPGGGGSGDRVFRVLCNGSTLLDDFDIYKSVGSFHALTKTFHHLKPTAQGKLNITFEPVVNYASISAIEVLDEAQ
jgi:hypothetical protein